jgi:hypothetical protein
LVQPCVGHDHIIIDSFGHLLVEGILLCFRQREVEEVLVLAYILFTQLCTPRRL